MRIIAGSRRGHTLAAPEGRDTRPTLDRVRESLFGILQYDIPGAVVLDLFAGSGGLGLEALSRGAAFAVFCDSGRQSARVVTQNIQKLRFEAEARLYPMDCMAALTRAKADGYCFDVVFLDPPYASGLYGPVMEKILAEGLLRPDGVMSVEHSPDAPPVTPAGFTEDTRRYGEVAVSIFRRETAL